MKSFQLCMVLKLFGMGGNWGFALLVARGSYVWKPFLCAFVGCEVMALMSDQLMVCPFCFDEWPVDCVPILLWWVTSWLCAHSALMSDQLIVCPFCCDEWPVDCVPILLWWVTSWLCAHSAVFQCSHGVWRCLVYPHPSKSYPVHSSPQTAVTVFTEKVRVLCHGCIAFVCERCWQDERTKSSAQIPLLRLFSNW